MGNPEILVLGHHGCAQVIRVHAFPKPGETISSLGLLNVKDSGKGGNQAICAGLLGCSVAFIGKLGDDEIGHQGATWMQERGVDTSGIIFSKDIATSHGIIFIDDQGQNTIVNGFRPDGYMGFEEIKQKIYERRSAKYFLTGFEIPVNIALESAKYAKELGMFTIVNPGPAPLHNVGDLSYVDILVPNETEARTLAEISDNEKVSNQSLASMLRNKCHAKSIVMTLGSDGILGLDDDGNWSFPAYKMKVVDTVGAGDAFVGGLLWGLSENRSLREATYYANIVAALSVTKRGSFPSYSTKQEVLEKIAVLESKARPKTND